jgi:hypothetical protein
MKPPEASLVFGSPRGASRPAPDPRRPPRPTVSSDCLLLGRARCRRRDGHDRRDRQRRAADSDDPAHCHFLQWSWDPCRTALRETAMLALRGLFTADGPTGSPRFGTRRSPDDAPKEARRGSGRDRFPRRCERAHRAAAHACPGRAACLRRTGIGARPAPASARGCRISPAPRPSFRARHKMGRSKAFGKGSATDQSPRNGPLRAAADICDSLATRQQRRWRYRVPWWCRAS